MPLGNVLPFIVLTVGLENHLKSKQINVYWAVKAPPSQSNNVLADRNEDTSPNSLSQSPSDFPSDLAL